MAKPGFKLVRDIYRRGNGRWAKVTRQHERINETWFPYYVCAAGVDGQIQARNAERFATKRQAIATADDWIEFGA